MTANVIVAAVVEQQQSGETAGVEIPASAAASAVESYWKLLPAVLDEGALFQVIIVRGCRPWEFERGSICRRLWSCDGVFLGVVSVLLVSRVL